MNGCYPWHSDLLPSLRLTQGFPKSSNVPKDLSCTVLSKVPWEEGTRPTIARQHDRLLYLPRGMIEAVLYSVVTYHTDTQSAFGRTSGPVAAPFATWAPSLGHGRLMQTQCSKKPQHHRCHLTGPPCGYLVSLEPSSCFDLPMRVQPPRRQGRFADGVYALWS